MSDHENRNLPAREPIDDPGLPEHLPRPTDVDAHLEQRAERQVSIFFGAATLLVLGFCVAYFAIGETTMVFGFNALNVALGGTLGLALLFIGLGAIQWAKKLMNDHEIVEMRHAVSSSAEDRADALAVVSQGADDSGFGRRPMIRNSLLGAMGALGLPTVVLLWDLGPMDETEKLSETVWEPGMRVVNDVSGTPIKPSDIQIGQLVNAEPIRLVPSGDEAVDEENRVLHGTELLQAKAKAAVILVRMRPEDINPPEGRENWGVSGILCFSKICTHVGCPISLWEQQTHHLLCPCHQSTFDLEAGGKVLFGPAARSLPQLPLGVDDEGYLIAMSDFTVTVGPSYPTMR